MIDLFGDLREAVQRAPSDGTSLGELVFALRYLDAMRATPSSKNKAAQNEERWEQLILYTRSALSRSRPPGSRATHWDVVSFCIEGADALEERAAGTLWGQTRDEAIRDARHWLASLAWALGSGAPKAQLHASIRSTNLALHTAWAPGQGVVKITARPSAGFVRDQWIASGESVTPFPGLPDHLYRALFRAARHAHARRLSKPAEDPSRFTLAAALAAR